MNNEVKIVMTVFTESRTAVRNGVVELINYSVENKAGGITKGFRKHKTVTHPVVKQIINMTQEAYDNFITRPIGCKPNHWKALPIKTRVDMHMKDVCAALGGKSYEFEIFED